MKTKLFLTSVLFSFAMSASAQIQLLYMDLYGRDVIDRNKKLYWMNGDDDPCYDILNYKKVGSKETFNLRSKEEPSDTYSVVINLLPNGDPKDITLTSKQYGKRSSTVETSSGDAREDARVIKYFKGLAGYPATVDASEVASDPKSAVNNAKEASAANATEKVMDVAKGAVNKVKGLFKKKK